MFAATLATSGQALPLLAQLRRKFGPSLPALVERQLPVALGAPCACLSSSFEVPQSSPDSPQVTSRACEQEPSLVQLHVIRCKRTSQGHALHSHSALLAPPPRLGRCWAELGRFQATVGRVQTSFGRYWATVGRTWAISGQIRSMSGQSWPVPGQLWPLPDKLWPALADFGGQTLVDPGPMLVELGHDVVELSPTSADSGQTWP